MTIYEYLNISKEEYKFKRDYIENPLKKLPRKGGGIEYEKPFDEDLKYMFIDLNLPICKINQIIGHKISDYLAKFKKKKYMGCPKISKEELVELYCNKHKTLRELADMFGYVGTVPIQNWLKKYEIEQKSPRYLKNKITKETLYTMYIEMNLSANNIAHKLNSTKKTILKEIQKFDIKKDLKKQQLSRFKSNHTDFQNELLLNSDKFEEFIIQNNIKSKKELAYKINLSYSSITKYLKKYGLKKYFNRQNNSDESIWLNSIGLPNDDVHRQVHIGKYIVDGYDPQSNTIYEYLGDYWHGNPRMFESNNVNLTIGKPFGELYKRTMDRIRDLKLQGYNVVYVWENDINPR